LKWKDNLPDLLFKNSSENYEDEPCSNSSDLSLIYTLIQLLASFALSRGTAWSYNDNNCLIMYMSHTF
jgi:hypothetical protein